MERNETNWEFSSCLNFQGFRWWIDDKTYCCWLQQLYEKEDKRRNSVIYIFQILELEQAAKMSP